MTQASSMDVATRGQGKPPLTLYEKAALKVDPGYEHDSVAERKLRRAKRESRSHLSVSGLDWQKKHYHHDGYLTDVSKVEDNLPRIHWKDLSPAEFHRQYEIPGRPVVITGLADSWECRDWTLKTLMMQYPELKMKVGVDDEGYPVKVKLKYFDHYSRSAFHRNDDSPLYIFDGNYYTHPALSDLAGAYQIPPLFPEDLFSLIRDRLRPPYRWLIMGPARSGTSLHTDPLSTSAWNTLLTGTKRWVLLPPQLPKELVAPSSLAKEASEWFARAYHRCKSHPGLRELMIEVVQKPGETIFVPWKWWHVVLNVDDTVAVTQNFVSGANFVDAWRHTAVSRPRLSVKWGKLLSKHRPDLIAIMKREDEDGYSSDTSSSSSSSATDYSDQDSLPQPLPNLPTSLRYKPCVPVPEGGWGGRFATVDEVLQGPNGSFGSERAAMAAARAKAAHDACVEARLLPSMYARSVPLRGTEGVRCTTRAERKADGEAVKAVLEAVKGRGACMFSAQSDASSDDDE